MKGHLDVKELEKCKKADLQKLAKELGVSTEGTIKELAERCAEVEVGLVAGALATGLIYMIAQNM